MDKRTLLKAGEVLRFPGMECTIENYIGRGSNAVIYEGSYPDSQFQELRHRVLIKELFPYHAGGLIFRNASGEICTNPDAAAVMELHRLSFLRGNEIHLQLLREHPQAVDSNLNTFELRGTLYTVLGFSGGRSLDKELNRPGAQNLPLTVHVRRLLGVLDVLEEFHSSGFLHLDISPDNILLIGDGRKERISLIDYNSVHTLEEIRSGTAVYYSEKEGYTAPEICSGRVKKIGFHSDLYALTGVFYRCLAGRTLTALQSVRGTVPDVSDAECLKAMPDTVRSMVNRILQRGFSSLTKWRYQSAAQMRTDLEELQDRIEGKGITHWALWESGRASIVRVVNENPALAYIRDPESLYPVIGENESGETAALEDFVRKMLSGNGASALLVGSGGAGKTTALLKTAYMQGQEYTPAVPAVIFLPLCGFSESDASFLKNRILEKLKFKSETDSMETARHELLRLLSVPLHTARGDCPQLLLLLDGFNEITCGAGLLLREIAELDGLPGVRILMTSRSSVPEIPFSRLYLRPLLETEVKKILSADGILPPENEQVAELIRSPLMLSIYIRAVKGQGEQLFVETREQLLDRYFAAMLEKERRDFPENAPQPWQVDAALRYILPEAAHLIRKKKAAVSDRELLAVVFAAYRRLGTGSVRQAFPEWIGHRSDIVGEAENAEEWYRLIVQDILWRRLGMLVRDEQKNYRIFHGLIEEYLAEKRKGFERILKRRAAVCSVLAAALIGGVTFAFWKWIWLPGRSSVEEVKQPYDETLAENVLSVAFAFYMDAGIQYEDLKELLDCLSADPVDEDAYERYERRCLADLNRIQALETEAALGYAELLPVTGEVMPWSGQAFSRESYEALIAAAPARAEDYLEYLRVLASAREDPDMWEYFGEEYLAGVYDVITADACVAGKYYNDVIAPELAVMESSEDEKDQQNYHLYMKDVALIGEMNQITSGALEAEEIYLARQREAQRKLRQNGLFKLTEEKEEE